MKVINNFNDYEIIDASCGMKLERWNNIYLLRPDPQVIWDNGDLLEKYKDIIHAYYKRSRTGGGEWINLRNVPKSWVVEYKNLKFRIRQMGFKHTGLFPEQSINWDYMINKIKKSKRNIKVLNLFAYTGGATIACLSAGASVVHVDSSRGMVDWALENVDLNKFSRDKMRYIIDDVVKFVKREVKRGNKYDAIIMDPPSYGRGHNKEVWNIEDSLSYLVSICSEVLSDDPLFFQINSYTTGLSPTVLENLLKIHVNTKYEGLITIDEVGINIGKSNLILPCGIYGRWEKKDE